MEDANRLPTPARIKQVLIDVFRCSKGQTTYVRTLSNGYGGLFTHYVSKRSQYCPGDRCSCQHRKQQRIWKGYGSVEIWVLDLKIWQPAVLEVTENLEHCLAGRWLRGQVWEISRRMPDSEQDSYPVVGSLQQQLDPDRIPRDFDWMPIMQRKFHVLEPLERHHKNPLPKPSFAVYTQDAPPAALAAKEERGPASPEEIASIREKLRNYGKVPSANGTTERGGDH